MALVSTPGMVYPTLYPVTFLNGYVSTGVIDATGEKVGLIGRIWWPGWTGGTKNIDKIGFRFGAVTKAGGSALTVSLQDVDPTTGPPLTPDGVQDQTVAIANANASFVTNTFILTGSLSSQRTVSFGDYVAIVIEYDGAGRLGADSVVISALNVSGVSATEATQLFTGAWASVSSSINCVFEFSDGSYGGFRTSVPSSASQNILFSSSSSPDEYAMKITMPFKAVVEGIIGNMIPTANTATYDVLLESSGGAVLGICSQDPNIMASVNSHSTYCKYPFASPVTLNAGDIVYASFRPTAAVNCSYTYEDVLNANYWQAYPYAPATNCITSSRTNGGAWTDNTLRKMQIGLMIQQIDDGTSGGGGGSGPFHARMHM